MLHIQDTGMYKNIYKIYTKYIHARFGRKKTKAEQDSIA